MAETNALQDREIAFEQYLFQVAFSPSNRSFLCYHQQNKHVYDSKEQNTRLEILG